jgi:hypothetical protein
MFLLLKFQRHFCQQKKVSKRTHFKVFLKAQNKGPMFKQNNKWIKSKVCEQCATSSHVYAAVTASRSYCFRPFDHNQQSRLILKCLN